MKIKHFAGYGSVNAKKLSKTTFKDEYDRPHTKIVIETWGNHEWGLVQNYKGYAYEWLIQRHFDKSAPNWIGNPYYSENYEDFYKTEGNLDVEHCIYTFTY